MKKQDQLIQFHFYLKVGSANLNGLNLLVIQMVSTSLIVYDFVVTCLV